MPPPPPPQWLSDTSILAVCLLGVAGFSLWLDGRPNRWAWPVGVLFIGLGTLVYLLWAHPNAWFARGGGSGP